MRLALWTARLRSLLVILTSSVLAVNVFFYFFPQPPRWLEPGGDLALPASGRVVVVAPHADDEVLAAGGLMQIALAQGLDVRVVFMTNGDGFPAAAAQLSGTLRPGPADYERLGAWRQQESLAALTLLGVPSDNVRFLGFPDGGLADLWQHYWAQGRPYRSRYTLRTEAVGTGADGDGTVAGRPYAGDAVVTELAQLFRQWEPQLIVLPHPADAHADHWATYNFATYALEWLRQLGEPWVNDLEAWHYVVHRGDWPAPKGLKPRAQLLPPPGLLSGPQQWQLLQLTNEQVTLKTEAILKHQSQVRLMRRYLLSFVRSNELFTRLPPLLVPMLAVGPGEQPEREALAVAMRLRSQDTLARRLEPAADVTELRAGQTADGVWLYAGTSGKRGVGIRYRLAVRTIRPDGQGPAWAMEWSRQRQPALSPLSEAELPADAQPTVLRSGDGWFIYVPWELLGDAGAMMVGMESYGTGGVRIGHSGWPLLIFHHP